MTKLTVISFKILSIMTLKCVRRRLLVNVVNFK